MFQTFVCPATKFTFDTTKKGARSLFPCSLLPLTSGARVSSRTTCAGYLPLPLPRFHPRMLPPRLRLLSGWTPAGSHRSVPPLYHLVDPSRCCCASPWSSLPPPRPSPRLARPAPALSAIPQAARRPSPCGTGAVGPPLPRRARRRPCTSRPANPWSDTVTWSRARPKQLS